MLIEREHRTLKFKNKTGEIVGLAVLDGRDLNVTSKIIKKTRDEFSIKHVRFSLRDSHR
jgi:hypothetical protein